VVQRSRAYVKQSQITAGAKEAMFPKREAPKVAEYSVKKTYGKLLTLLEKAFNKKQPLFTLPMYYPLAYSKVPVADGFAENRQKQVVGLIRILFLKRFESSARAFESSCQQLLLQSHGLCAGQQHHQARGGGIRALEAFTTEELLGDVQKRQNQLFDDGVEDEAEQDEDVIPEEMLEAAECLTATSSTCRRCCRSRCKT
jgi:hypothetical protein